MKNLAGSNPAIRAGTFFQCKPSEYIPGGPKKVLIFDPYSIVIRVIY
jgi:hypothetical protein